MKTNKSPILAIFFTVFIDLLGLGIIIPILPALLLDPSAQILPLSASFSTRTMVFGFLIAAYPLAQFFGAPILGTLADRYGRRKLLLISLIGTLVGYVLMVVGIMTQNLLLIFASRLVDGFTGGNISIAQSAIADISDEKNKSRNFGLIGMAFGLGFIIGPYIGGKLSDSTVVSWFTYSTPFFLSIILTAVNLILVFTNFPETLKEKRIVKVSIFTGFKNIRKALTLKDLRIMFLVGFLLTVGFNFFTQFFQVFLIGKFQFTQSNVGDFFAYMGLWIAIAQGAFLRPLSKKYSPVTLMTYSILLLAIVFPLQLIPKTSLFIYLIIPFVAIFQGIVQPNTTTVISNLAEPGKQGEILGINQSIVSLAQAIPPIIAGFITAISMNLPTLFAAGSTFIAWIIFVSFFRKSIIKQPLEIAHSTT